MNIKFLRTICFCTTLLFSAISCEIEEIENPNGPSRTKLEENPTIGELNNLVSGTESLMRSELGFYYDVTSIIGREYYFFTTADPRYTGEILGKGEAQLDNAGFYGTRPYAGRYATILNANVLIAGIANTKADLTQEEKNGYLGFAKTAQAYSYLLALNLQYDNGIRIDVSDVKNPGPFVGYAEALTVISALLDEAYTLLGNSGDTFRFRLSSGFDPLDDDIPPSPNAGLEPEEFATFNRAIKARVELYRGNKSAALEALNASFMDMNLDLNLGPNHYYSSAGGDIVNPVFRQPNRAEAIVVHPSFVNDVRPGDDRVATKTAPRDVASSDGLSGDLDVALYTSLSSPIPIIRNEELILIYAEANIGANNAEAVNALNVIRNAHNLTDYTGGMDDASLIEELLYNRRYSLFGEGHRWIDLRRYNRLNELPIDRPGDDVWIKMPRPVSEIGVNGG